MLLHYYNTQRDGSYWKGKFEVFTVIIIVIIIIIMTMMPVFWDMTLCD